MRARTTTDAFGVFDDRLKLDPLERARAEAVHNAVTALLKAAGVIVSAFLQGSFARKTMLAPLRDIDKVVILHPDLRRLSPDQVMDRIEAVVARAYPSAEFERSRHALKIDFGPESFTFDVVPAWETPTDDDDVLIANRDTGGWDRSNTRTLIRVVADRNDATDGQFIHQARMGKQAIKHLLDGSIPGLHVESWGYDSIVEALPHDEALALLLEQAATSLGGVYYDPTGVDPISRRLDPAVVAHAQPVLQQAAAGARRALEFSRADRHEAAIRNWHGIFGDCFPAPSDSDGAALRAAFTGAGISSGGQVTRKAKPIRPVRSWGQP